jgi:hypothetical protein
MNWEQLVELVLAVPLFPPQIPHDYDLACNPDSRDGNPASNRLSYDTACVQDARVVSEE